VSIHVATNLPVVIANQQKQDNAGGVVIEKDTLDESNLSNLYKRIMSGEHQHNFVQKSGLPQEDKKEGEISMVESEFNPPTQQMGTSFVYKQQDLTFQSGMSELRKAL
jgi:hypothetical protein